MFSDGLIRLTFLKRKSSWLLLSFVLLAVACGKYDASNSSSNDESSNTTDPYWVKQIKPHKRVAVVFVHGLFGSTKSSWNNDDGTGFFKFLSEAEGVGDRIDIFAFGFTSNMFSSGSLDIREAANKLEQTLIFNGIWDYESVVFVAHSMGGLVTLREIIAHPERRERVPLIVLYATPARGADITNIGKLVVNNPAVAQMLPADGNALLQQLSDDWGLIPPDNKPAIVCAYETAKTYTQVIVSWSNAVAFCNGAPTAIGGANHLDIVKPNRATHDSMVVLINALREYVLSNDNQAFLETPDFLMEDGKWVLHLNDPNGKTPARLVNNGRLAQSYTISAVSDPKLIILPDPTPRPIAPRKQEELKIFLQRGGDLKNQYEFTLSTPVMGPREVIVKLVDKETIIAAQADLAEAVATQLKEYFDSKQAVQWFERATDEQRVDAIVDTAKAGLSSKAKGLPPEAEWILTADILNSAGMSKYAKKALSNAEIDPNKSTNAEAIKQLVESIERRPNLYLLKSDEKLPGNDALWLKASYTKNVVNEDNANAWRALSERMQTVSTLKAEGLNIKGDVLRSQGNEKKASELYMQAAQLKSASMRIKIEEDAGEGLGKGLDQKVRTQDSK